MEAITRNPDGVHIIEPGETCAVGPRTRYLYPTNALLAGFLFPPIPGGKK